MALENIMEFYDDKHFTSGLTDLLPKHYQNTKSDISK